MNTAFICTTCGQQQAESQAPPPNCPICLDSRQYVLPAGQTWTTPEALARRHASTWRLHEPGLLGIGIAPQFAIGQRALLVDTGEGWVLWDCIPLLDDAIIALVKGLGGLRAIAISHPHYYAAMVDWSRAFGDVPVWLHEADRQWVLRPDPCIHHWSGPTHALAPNLTLVHTGGHFEGACVLHWSQGANGQGALMTGDTIQVAPNREVSFLRSYPNMTPLSHDSVQAIADATAPYGYDRLYGAFFDRVVPGNAKAVVASSVARYQAALQGRY